MVAPDGWALRGPRLWRSAPLLHRAGVRRQDAGAAAGAAVLHGGGAGPGGVVDGAEWPAKG